MRKNTERPAYNIYFENSASSVSNILMGSSKMYPGEYSRFTMEGTEHIVIYLSKRDMAMSPSGTVSMHTRGTNPIKLRGSYAVGFYKVVEINDYSADGTQYTAFCTGNELIRVNVDFEPQHHMRLDRRVKSKPVTTGDLEQLLRRAVNDEDLKDALVALLKEEDNTEDKKKNSKSPKPARE